MAPINSKFSRLAPEQILGQVSEISLQVQQCRKLEDICQWAISNARRLLQTDRVLIYRLLVDDDAVIAFESVGSDWTPIIGQLIYDPCLKETWIERYRQGQVTSIPDIHAGHLPKCYVALLEQLQVRANLVVPICNQRDLWGLLITHHCRGPREWQSLEVQYLQQIALHLSIAIQQTELRQEQQRLVSELEQRSTATHRPDLSQSEAVYPVDVSRAETEHKQADAQVRPYERIISATPDCISLRDRNYIYQVVNQSYLEWCQKSYSAPVMIWSSGTDPLCTFFNDVWLNASGLTLEQELSNGWPEGVHSDDLQRCLETYLTAFHAHQPFEMEYRLRRADGEYQWILDRGTPRFMPDGEFAGFIGFCTDITDRKHTEQTLSFQEALLRSMTDASPLAFYVVDNRTDQILYFNHRFCQIWGIEHLEAQLKTGQLKNNDIIPACIPMIVDVSAFVESCKPLQSEENRCTIEDEIAFVDGRIIRRFSSQIRDHHDQYFGRLYLFEDITARKQLEKSLWLANASLEHIAVSATWIDADARICRVNVTTSQTLGYSREELESMTIDQIDPNFSSTQFAQFWELLKQQQDITFTSQHRTKAGEIFPVEVTAHYMEFAGEAYSFSIAKDIQERLRREQQLQLQSTALEACADIIMITDERGTIEWVNPAFTGVTGYSLEESVGRNPSELVKSGLQDQEFYKHLWADILAGKTWRGEIINRRKDGSFYIESTAITPVRDLQGQIRHFVAIKQDISDRKRVELAIQQQAEREHMVWAITNRIRQSLDLTQILNTTVTEVRHFLTMDRVLIYRFNPDWSGVVIAESVAEGWQSILGKQITDTYFLETQGQFYLQGRITAIDDIYTANLALCHIEMLEQLQVRAKLVVPILQDTHLWGLLVAHHCQGPWEWENLEITLQQQLATQISIAIQQSELYQQLQVLNTSLELQVQERTAQLQQSLDFEALLRRITQQIRDSLDEEMILQHVVQELAIAMKADCCDTAIYNVDRTISTIKCEYNQSGFTFKDAPFKIAESSDPDLYRQFFEGHYCHFCLIGQNVARPGQPQEAILAVPIVDDQGVLGDLWLFKPAQEGFSYQEISLVQQVANQCAIALRQSRLYQAAQTQVQELQRLNQLKDDFLSTVSHELRTPMSNITMATQMLDISFNRLDVLADESNTVNHYFRVLQEEGQREINLIDDLLSLTRLDAGTEPLTLTDIELQLYLPHLAEPFVERMQQQQQQFVLQIPASLPPVTTDLPYLERVMTELLHNACKYTPAGEMISLSVQAKPDAIEISVSNTGVEIPETEYERIFDKFYRIPNNDPWKHGGTGLGLALVKKLVEQMKGKIWVESGNNMTQFIVQLRPVSERRALEMTEKPS